MKPNSQHPLGLVLPPSVQPPKPTLQDVHVFSPGPDITLEVLAEIVSAMFLGMDVALNGNGISQLSPEARLQFSSVAELRAQQQPSNDPEAV